ncbi:hypothetical protein SAMN04488587_0824 [Methanococcoides vulcani]|uniref:Uncharacterized protein n=1 Tax=Methanococcoides vulcani TaxID=1353158 RepID=A0A1H9Z423_9EURY|nr:DUF5803 family protein [Methanococcoides vulcani]SES75777.1 hypothetical protein SAMN04488587_0824 [Methanococcoides vulcani]
MKKQIITVVFIFALAVLASGCINELVPVDEEVASPDLSIYELEVFYDPTDDAGFVNTTTFYLANDGSANVVHMIVNASVIEVVPLEDMLNQNKETISNIVILAGSSNDTEPSFETFERLSTSSIGDVPVFNYTMDDEVLRGQKHIYIRFNESITGIVAYSLATPKGPDFMYVPAHDSVVRFVLPEGYTTGNPFVGKVNPEPAERYFDDLDREVLVWYDLRATAGSFTEMARDFLKVDVSDEDFPYKPIIVKFYQTSAPRMLLIGTSILGAGVLIVLGNYLSTRRKLRKARELIEEGFDEKRRSEKK